MVLGDWDSPVWFLETGTHQFVFWRLGLSRMVLGDWDSPVWFLETGTHQFGFWRLGITIILGE